MGRQKSRKLAVLLGWCRSPVRSASHQQKSPSTPTTTAAFNLSPVEFAASFPSLPSPVVSENSPNHIRVFTKVSPGFNWGPCSPSSSPESSPPVSPSVTIPTSQDNYQLDLGHFSLSEALEEAIQLSIADSRQIGKLKEVDVDVTPPTELDFNREVPFIRRRTHLLNRDSDGSLIPPVLIRPNHVPAEEFKEGVTMYGVAPSEDHRSPELRFPRYWAEQWSHSTWFHRDSVSMLEKAVFAKIPSDYYLWARNSFLRVNETWGYVDLSCSYNWCLGMDRWTVCLMYVFLEHWGLINFAYSTFPGRDPYFKWDGVDPDQEYRGLPLKLWMQIPPYLVNQYRVHDLHGWPEGQEPLNWNAQVSGVWEENH